MEARRSPMAHRTKRSGFSILESIIATAIVGVALMGIVNLFTFSYGMTQKTGALSLAYSAGRNSLENVRSQGFYNASEGTSTTYYASDGTGPSSTQGTNRYRVVVTVASDKFATSGGTTVVAEDALRAVKVVVTDLTTSTTVYSAGTTLARGGI